MDIPLRTRHPNPRVGEWENIQPYSEIKKGKFRFMRSVTMWFYPERPITTTTKLHPVIRYYLAYEHFRNLDEDEEFSKECPYLYSLFSTTRSLYNDQFGAFTIYDNMLCPFHLEDPEFQARYSNMLNEYYHGESSATYYELDAAEQISIIEFPKLIIFQLFENDEEDVQILNTSEITVLKKISRGFELNVKVWLNNNIEQADFPLTFSFNYEDNMLILACHARNKYKYIETNPVFKGLRKYSALDKQYTAISKRCSKTVTAIFLMY
jgi:hypothetical protein